jgi:hypothetical protein
MTSAWAQSTSDICSRNGGSVGQDGKDNATSDNVEVWRRRAAVKFQSADIETKAIWPKGQAFSWEGNTCQDNLKNSRMWLHEQLRQLLTGESRGVLACRFSYSKEDKMARAWERMCAHRHQFKACSSAMNAPRDSDTLWYLIAVDAQASQDSVCLDVGLR